VATEAGVALYTLGKSFRGDVIVAACHIATYSTTKTGLEDNDIPRTILNEGDKYGSNSQLSAEVEAVMAWYHGLRHTK
jgi:hypothetical protein